MAARLACSPRFSASVALDPIPEGLIDERHMLPGIGGALAGDLTPADAVLQHLVEGAALEWPGADFRCPLRPTPRAAFATPRSTTNPQCADMSNRQANLLAKLRVAPHPTPWL